MTNLYSCPCGGFKFYVFYSTAWCAVCGRLVAGKRCADWDVKEPDVIPVRREVGKCITQTGG